MKKKLLLESKGLSKNINNFLTEVSSSDKALKKFTENPLSYLLQIFPKEIKDDVSNNHITDGNKLMFSILSNNEFKNWVLDYQNSVEKIIKSSENKSKSIDELFPKDKVIGDLSQALMKYGDQEIMKNVLNASDRRIQNAGTYVVLDDVAVVVAAVAAIVVVLTAIDVTPLTDRSNTDILVDSQKMRSLSETMVAKAKYFRRTRRI